MTEWVDKLKEGDFVAFKYNSYAPIKRGTVVEFTQKLVRVKFQDEIKSFYKHSRVLQGYSNDWAPPRISEWTEDVEKAWKLQNIRMAINNKLDKIKEALHTASIDILVNVNGRLEDVMRTISKEDD